MSANNKHIPVFIGSTYEDLIEYREAVKEALVRLKTVINGMEYFGSKPGKPLDECLKMVRESKIYIGIFAMRYGSVESSFGKSFTHLEYIEAQRLDLPSLIYIIDERNQPILPKFVDTGEKAELLKKLKEELKEKFTLSYFTTPTDLAKRIAQDLPPLLEAKQIINKQESISTTERLKELGTIAQATLYSQIKADGLRLIITDRNSPILTEILKILDWKNYGILAPNLNNDGIKSFTKATNHGISEDASRYTFYRNPEIINQAQFVIYIDNLPYTMPYEDKPDYSKLHRFIYTAFLPSTAYLIRAESLGKRIVFISERNSRVQNELGNFMFHYLDPINQISREHLTHPTIWLSYREFSYRKEKEGIDKESRMKFRNSLTKLIENFNSEIVPISVSVFAKFKRLTNTILIINPKGKFLNLSLASLIDRFFSTVTRACLELKQNLVNPSINVFTSNQKAIEIVIEAIMSLSINSTKIIVSDDILNSDDMKYNSYNRYTTEFENFLNSILTADDDTALIVGNKLLIEKTVGRCYLNLIHLKPVSEHIG